MDKNTFLVINDLIFEMYGWQSLADIKEDFFQRLKIIIPFHYASILLKTSGAGQPLTLGHPICFPQSFLRAENAYLSEGQDSDYTLWNLYARESKLLRASDILDDEKRLNSPLYVNCYRSFDVYDDMQLTIVAHEELLGLLTLYRTRADGAFTAEDMFFLRALGMHLNLAMHRILAKKETPPHPPAEALPDIARTYRLTAREKELLSRLSRFETNEEIADALGIRESTLQKHLQNLFRKLGVTSKWDVLRLCYKSAWNSCAGTGLE